MEELESLYEDVPFEAEERDDYAYIRPTATNFPASQKIKEFSKKKRAKAAKCLSSWCHSSNIQKCIKDQFSTFSDTIFKAMCIIDCFRWD